MVHLGAHELVAEVAAILAHVAVVVGLAAVWQLRSMLPPPWVVMALWLLAWLLARLAAGEVGGGA